MHRRHLLFAATLALVAAGLPRYSLAVPTEAQAEGYGGAVDGAWACGPRATVTYGGVGGRVRVHPASDPTAKPGTGTTRPLNPSVAEDDEGDVQWPANHEPPREPSGVSIGVAAAGESRNFERTRCNDNPCSDKDVVPPSRVLGGASADVGGDWTYFGFHVGGLATQYWKDNDDRDPTLLFLPNLELRFARRVGVHGIAGFGEYSSATIMRPGLYGGVGWQSEDGLAVEGRAALNLAFDGMLGGRLDARVRVPIADEWGIGFGIASQTAKTTLPEGSLFFVWTP